MPAGFVVAECPMRVDSISIRMLYFSPKHLSRVNTLIAKLKSLDASRGTLEELASAISLLPAPQVVSQS